MAGLIRRFPNYTRLAWALARDPRLSRVRRAAVLAGAAYLVSPVDLVPGVIPVVGQLDDVIVALGAIRLALNGLKPQARVEKLADAGLTQEQLDGDLRTAGRTAAWLGRAGVRLGTRAVSSGIELARRVLSR